MTVKLDGKTLAVAAGLLEAIGAAARASHPNGDRRACSNQSAGR
jgi:hypothetical protein